ncbi:unannotated protein [freshwater metagenome]|uniref:Unannotated protein n=1 Tax=freshwater metagenome TaxID=449393 RepID=A0A6J7K1G5_9ZZZZ
MDGLFIGKMSTLGDFDGIDLADEIGDRGIGGGELLAVALVSVHPANWSGVAHFGHEVASGLGDRGVGVVVDLGTGDDRHPFVEQIGE